MDKKFFPLIIIVLFTTFLCSQTNEMPNIKVEPIFKGEHKIVVGMTNSIPPNEITKVDGYDYQIKIQ